jgi:two-component system, sensor histidine kinase and response regulator
MHATSLTPEYRILVAEDNIINQKVFELILRKAGFQVHVVSDGKQALEAHRSTPYDLILMDLQMPEMDGLEATRQIRSLAQKQPIIIAVTADIIAGVRERCLEAGMDDYVSKPVSREQLLGLVRTAPERFATANTIRRAS